MIGNERAVNQFCYRNEDRFLEDESIEEKIKPGALTGGETHIIFVNGDYKNDKTEIGKLIHDFKCSKAEDMYFPNLADRMMRIKEDPEEVEKVCKVIEDVRKETEERTELRTLVRAIRNVMISFNVSVEKAMESLNVPADQRSRYAKIVSSQAYRYILLKTSALWSPDLAGLVDRRVFWEGEKSGISTLEQAHFLSNFEVLRKTYWKCFG